MTRQPTQQSGTEAENVKTNLNGKVEMLPSLHTLQMNCHNRKEAKSVSILPRCHEKQQLKER